MRYPFSLVSVRKPTVGEKLSGDLVVTAPVMAVRKDFGIGALTYRRQHKQPITELDDLHVIAESVLLLSAHLNFLLDSPVILPVLILLGHLLFFVDICISRPFAKL